MTPEQASKLRKGGRILFEVKVIRPNVEAVGLERIYCIAARPVAQNADANWNLYVPISDIHSILPRPLEAGDRVKDDDSTLEGTILAIADGEAWVRWPAGDTTVEPLSDLQRVEDQ